MKLNPSEVALSKMLGIEFPLIVAPMFLVSNQKMIIAALQSGVTGAIPALNYRTVEELRTAIREIRGAVDGPFGINLIVNKSNFLYKDQLKVCCEEKVDFIITSLGSPRETIEMAHEHGVLVFCDVVDEKYARKVEELGADAIIAVNKEAGGHAGPTSFKELLPKLKASCSIPIISAGGVGNGEEAFHMLKNGADGLSVGSLFIATEESDVSEDYKRACVEYGKDDIVMTTKLSGTPCTVINTPYVQKVGTKQNWLERFLNKNKRLKKWMKALTFVRGSKKLQKAAFSTTYKTVWCAGPSIEHVHAIRSVKEIVQDLKEQFDAVQKSN
jgi:nitronate monooxygenase